MPRTVRTSASIPSELVTAARDRFPATREMTTGRLLRYALARALGKTDAEAIALTKDPRTPEVRNLLDS